jgi:hypothetical protein
MRIIDPVTCEEREVPIIDPVTGEDRLPLDEEWDHPFHGKGVAEFRCNACGKIYKRDLGWKTWTPSFCEETGKKARLYRISAPIKKDSLN